MWISRRTLRDLTYRIERLEKKVEDLHETPRIYAENGKVYTWAGGKFRLIDAVNLIAKHVGIKLEQTYPAEPELKCLPQTQKGSEP